jgi:hypothetical protein
LFRCDLYEIFQKYCQKYPDGLAMRGVGKVGVKHANFAATGQAGREA